MNIVGGKEVSFLFIQVGGVLIMRVMSECVINGYMKVDWGYLAEVVPMC